MTTFDAEQQPHATYIRQVRGKLGGQTDARLYRLEPALQTEDGREARYVVVSAIDESYVELARFCETYIFEANVEGHVQNYRELPGSFQGEVNHEEALARAGYELILGMPEQRRG